MVVVVWGESRDGRRLVCGGKCGISDAHACHIYIYICVSGAFMCVCVCLCVSVFVCVRVWARVIPQHG